MRCVASECQEAKWRATLLGVSEHIRIFSCPSLWKEHLLLLESSNVFQKYLANASVLCHCAALHGVST